MLRGPAAGHAAGGRVRRRILFETVVRRNIISRALNNPAIIATRASHFYMYSVDGPRSSSILRKSLALWILAALLALALGDAGSSGFLCRRSLLEALSIQSSGEAV